MKTILPHSKKSEQMRNAYDGSAEFYDSRYQVIQYMKYAILFQKLIEVHNTSKVTLRGPLLDIGGGTGLFLTFLKDGEKFLERSTSNDEKIDQILHFAWFMLESTHALDPSSIEVDPIIIGDISFNMLQVARKNNTSSMLYGLVACDSANLPFRTSQFPTITAFTVFQNISDIRKALKETSRVIMDDGQLGISILKKQYEKFHFAHLLADFFQDISPVPFQENWEKFQNKIVQNGKYSQFYDLEKNEDFFLIVKTPKRNKK